MNTPTDQLANAISKSLEIEIERIVSEEAKAAALRVEERVRKLSLKMATKVASHTIYEVMEDRITITLKLPHTHQAGN